jgi:hypothetical protein
MITTHHRILTANSKEERSNELAPCLFSKKYDKDENVSIIFQLSKT